ncbi:HBR141Cp [Eremothecium sinecaudum]|uniref:HBR141Cp n=1 Tax=Eremothecium sinecaudum TaxID=45286 RepID=A0A109UXN7_9SACH|nr:HBR141Cp [Eremothecium sinecaudum]AMD19042.1 HBR141Cp [Eremothecium sinecaudum]
MISKVQGQTLLGIGSDIVFLPRFRKIIKALPAVHQPSLVCLPSICRKFMHPMETEHLKSLLLRDASNESAAVRYIAGVWATKEAVYKALSSSVVPDHLPPASTIYTKLCYKVNYQDVGRPMVILDPKFRSKTAYKLFWDRYVTNSEFLVTISHDTDYLISFVAHVRNEYMSEMKPCKKQPESLRLMTTKNIN